MIKKFAMAVLGAVALTAAASAVLPRTWTVERRVSIHAEPERVYAALQDLRRWQEWSVWTRAIDPQLRNIYEGPADGLGAKWSWLGPQMGQGSVEIVEANAPTRLVLQGRIEGPVENARLHFELTPTTEGTELRWRDEGTLPLRVGGFFRATVEEQLGEAMERSLRQLKAHLEATR